MSSSRSSSTTRAQQKSPIPGPPMASNQPMEDRSREVDYMEDKVQLDADLQIQWSNWMSDDASPSSYRRVFVLLLSWHPECDDMAVDSEVKRLGATFEDMYNFDVTSVHIDSREKMLPQVQANLAVASFVGKNDQEDALFIVYYAGHGSPGKNMGDLNMSGRRKQNKQNMSKEYSHITWNHVESNLKTTRADVFLIFDCCYSDDLGRGAAPLNSRSFEYLAASTTDYTPSPGEKSFTSALIWALKELATPKSSPRGVSSPMFTTIKLSKVVRDAPHFPKDQKPSLTMRDPDAYRHIVLAPLPKEGDSAGLSTISEHSSARGHVTEDSEEEEDPHKGLSPQLLSLTFHFKCEQETEDLRKLALNLRRFMKHDTKELHQVQWSGIWGGSGRVRPPARHRFREAVGKVLRTHRLSETSSGYPSADNGINLGPTESTPLLSDNSSAATSITLNPKRPHLIYQFFAFFRNLKGSKSKARDQPNGTGPSRKSSKPWRSRFLRKLRGMFATRSSSP